MYIFIYDSLMNDRDIDKVIDKKVVEGADLFLSYMLVVFLIYYVEPAQARNRKPVL